MADNKKVLVVIITKDRVKEKCYDSVLNQDYNLFNTLIRISKPEFQNKNKTIQTYLNCSANREKARKMALASDANYFLFLDSDIVLPKGAISNLILQNKPVIGGWYKIKNDPTGRYVAGKWVADNTLVNLCRPEPSVIKVDAVGMGCVLIKREVLEKIAFEDGTNTVYQNQYGEDCLLGECGAFGNSVAKLGYNMYMDGDVVCGHLGEDVPI